jgi:hypothetical protein
VAFQGQQVWLDYLEYNEAGMMLQLSFDFEGDDTPFILWQDHSHFRSILLDALNAKYQLFNNGSYQEEVDQAAYLADYTCSVCRENGRPTTAESLEPLPAPIHVDADETEELEQMYSPALTTAGFHERAAEHLDILAYRNGKLQVSGTHSTSTALVPYFVVYGLEYDIEVRTIYEPEGFHTYALQSWKHFREGVKNYMFNPPLLLRVGPDNRGW